MNRPQITDAECLVLSKKLGIDISNRTFRKEKWPVVKLNGSVLDTSFSFHPIDKRWTDIAKKFKGDVLILGLGFGKAVLNACAKSSVKSVTVVEMNEGMIDLFAINNKDIKGKSKLSIHHGDALEYSKTKFDHVFIDLFHDVRNLKEYDSSMSKLRETFKKSTIHVISLI